MRYDEYISAEEMELIEELQGKIRMEQDQIIGEYENEYYI